MNAPIHSSLGPSSAKRWINCPGSVAASANCPPQSPSEFAAEGTVAHTLAEEITSGKATAEQLINRIGETVMQDGFEVEITEEMVNAAIEYHDIIRRDLEEILAQGKNQPVVERTEVRVTASSVDEEVKGTADKIIYQKGNKLKVYDFKYGKGVVVDPKENEQATIYAIGVMDSEAGWAYDEIELVIIQPRAGGDSVRRWTVPTGYLLAFKVMLRESVVNTRKPNAPLKAGTWCRFCPAKATCPEVYKHVQRQAAVVFADKAPAPLAKGTLPDVGQLPIEKLTAALDWEDHINSWFEAARLRVRSMLESGLEVPGYKLVDGKSNRKWVDEDKVIAEFAPLLGREALFEHKLLSPAKLEKVVGKGKLEEKGLTFKPEVPKAVAKWDDKRPAVATSAAEVFKSVPAPRPKAQLQMEDPFAVPAPVILAAPELKDQVDDLLGELEGTKRKKIWA